METHKPPVPAPLCPSGSPTPHLTHQSMPCCTLIPPDPLHGDRDHSIDMLGMWQALRTMLLILLSGGQVLTHREL